MFLEDKGFVGLKDCMLENFFLLFSQYWHKNKYPSIQHTHKSLAGQMDWIFFLINLNLTFCLHFIILINITQSNNLMGELISFRRLKGIMSHTLEQWEWLTQESPWSYVNICTALVFNNLSSYGFWAAAKRLTINEFLISDANTLECIDKFPFDRRIWFKDLWMAFLMWNFHHGNCWNHVVHFNIHRESAEWISHFPCRSITHT